MVCSARGDRARRNKMANSTRKAGSGSDLAGLARRAILKERANLSMAGWVQSAVRNQEGLLTDTGALAVQTGERTGRSPKDRFLVKEAESEAHIDWNKINQPIEPARFEQLQSKITRYLTSCKNTFLTDGEVCTEPAQRMCIRLITEYAWQALFAHDLFRRPSPKELLEFQPDWTILAAPNCEVDPKQDGVPSDAFIGISFSRRL